MPGRRSAKVPWERYDHLLGDVPDKPLARRIVDECPEVGSLSWNAVRKRRLKLGVPVAERAVWEAQRQSTYHRSWVGAAQRLGMSLEAYTEARSAGLRWCNYCRTWQPERDFSSPEATRPDRAWCHAHQASRLTAGSDCN